MLDRGCIRKNIALKVVISALIILVAGSITFGTCLYISNIQKKDARLAEVKAKDAALALKEAKRKQPVYITLPGAKPIRAIIDDYTKPNSIWTIVSKTHPISIDYVSTNLKIPNVKTRTDKSDLERSIRSDIEKPTINMFDTAKSAGHLLIIGSGYRSAPQQKIYFDNLTASVGEAAANNAIAKPGQSEHQTGLSMDISTLSRNCYLDECFATTSDGLWLADNSYKFGFILRYPKGSEAITEYQYEPWHFRYVGVDLATALHESNLTLDQAWPYLQKADTTLRQNGAI